jgi:cytoplasmic iron level regulating protein YaaA (DUF328/UPF0246 family)
MIILLHSSKSMRSPKPERPLRPPVLAQRAHELAAYLATLGAAELEKSMHVSAGLAQKTKQMLGGWSEAPKSLAIDSFVGDIYSGLRANDLSPAEREYADEHLRILSGLYGILKPFDAISPYRLEMGYRLPGERYRDLYKFWGDAIAATLPAQGSIINLAAVEYSRTVTPFVDAERVVSPRFLTVDPKTGNPEFVVVHAKIARGAFAHWLIKTRAGVDRLTEFDAIGYRFEPALSSPAEPAFVARTFEGKGRSVRLLNQ